MDVMDVFSELEEMASMALNEPEGAEPRPANELFGNNVNRTQENVGVLMDTYGYDEEELEHMSHPRDMDLKATPHTPTHVANPREYLIKLEGPIDSTEIFRGLGHMPNLPEVFRATNEDGDTTAFCKIGEKSKGLIVQHFKETGSRFEPTIIKYNLSRKDLSNTSIYPTLGCDATLPQNRTNGDNDDRLLPAQDQYPVWYFFYGTLADPDILGKQVGGEINYREASIKGGVLKTWGGKYKALVDAPDGKAPPVEGMAFLVMDKEMEDALRTYETENYEVVRCLIEMAGSVEKVRGLTFRFAGGVDGLE